MYVAITDIKKGKRLSNAEAVKFITKVQKQLQLQLLLELFNQLLPDEQEKLIDYARLLINARSSIY